MWTSTSVSVPLPVKFCPVSDAPGLPTSMLGLLPDSSQGERAGAQLEAPWATPQDSSCWGGGEPPPPVKGAEPAVTAVTASSSKTVFR
jgi:hypothetical protein